MILREMHHVGIVVPDLDAGRARFTELLGIVWGPAISTDIELRDGDGRDFTTSLRISFSTNAPYLELIEERAGTPWVCNEHSNLHHISYFSDDLAGDTASFGDSQCPLEVCERDGVTAPTTFTYSRDTLGFRVELVNAAAREAMKALMVEPTG